MYTKTPMFVLEIPLLDGVIPPICSETSGHWIKEEGSYFFETRTMYQDEVVQLRLLPDQQLGHLLPVFDYAMDQSLKLCLIGTQEEDRYCIEDITHSNKKDLDSTLSLSHMFSDYSPDLFRQIIAFLQRNIEGDQNIPFCPIHLNSDKDREAVLEICGPWFPDWVKEALIKARNIQKHPSRSSDAKSHARRVFEILVNIDWNPRIIQVPGPEKVRQILDELLCGMEDVKVIIEEVFSQIRHSGRFPNYGILLHGKPGCGKTTVAKAFSTILGMCSVFIDLSTVGTENSVISGTSSIYHNAKPGLILDAIYRNHSASCILVVNELDKARDSGSGSSVSDVLLSILDNSGCFFENYLEELLPVNAFTIATCNDLDKISPPLRDRFYLIHVPDYSLSEKKKIVRDFVIPRMLKENGISPDSLTFHPEVISLLLQDYPHKTIRDLQRHIQRFIGDYFRQLSRGTPVTCYRTADVRRLLGPGSAPSRQFDFRPGTAWGGYVHQGTVRFFPVEVAITPGSGKFAVLGPVSDIQKEYCRLAYLAVHNGTKYSLNGMDVRVFIPEALPTGSVNYVGLATYAAICSSLLGRALNPREVYIGGCSLTGRLYLQELDLLTLISEMEENGFTTLYGPAGTGSLLDPRHCADSSITVLEAQDGATLFQLAAVRSVCRG